MTLTVTIAPLNGKIGLNKSQKFTATPSGAVADSTFAYEWFVDGKVQTGKEDATFDYVGTSLGEKTLKVNVISRVEGSVETETAEASTKLTVELNKMTGVTAIASAQASVPMGGPWTANVVVSGQPSGSTVEYEWTNGQLGNKAAGTADSSVPIKLKCTANVSHAGYEPLTLTSNEVTITVTKIELPGLVGDISVTPNQVKVSETYKLEAVASVIPDGATFAFKWDTGETTQAVDVVALLPGVITHTCVITASHPDYLDSVLTKTATAAVEEPFGPEVDAVYVHPLPHRNSAYIRSGWWVMDEIDRLTNLGIDWKTAPSDSKYSLHLKVLAKMLVDYPEVDVQESRNGRIVHRSAFEVDIV